MSACILWDKSTRPNGYGAAVLDGKCTSAHRLVYTQHYGAIPNGMQVLHKCDNPPCVNPAHLFVGTQKDNMRDKHAKGRDRNGPRLRGADHPKSIFTEVQVRKMLKLHRSGKKICAINKRFGGTYSSIWSILNGRSWKHITNA